ncbi:MAG: glycosyltransferase [Pseudomonadota bacterium]
MEPLSAIAAWISLAWAALAAGLTGVALFQRWRFGMQARAYRAPSGARPRVLLVRPCAGDEPYLERCLSSVVRARHHLDLRIVHGVSQADDGAVPTIVRVVELIRAAGLQAEHRVVAPRGPNLKASTLSGLTEELAGQFDVVVNVDSNVDLEGFDLDALVAPLVADTGVGATWAPPHEHSDAPTLGSRAAEAVLSGSLHAFGLLMGLDPAGLVGKTWALRSDALQAMGGFSPLVNYLGEDHELAARVQRAGLRVVPMPSPVRSLVDRRSVDDTVQRQARWLMVIRAQRPWLLLTYPMFFCGAPAVTLLAWLGSLAQPRVAGWALLLAWAARWTQSALARLFSNSRPGISIAVVDALLGDWVLWRSLARSLGSREFAWRGRRLRIDRGGLLSAVDGKK